MTSHSRRGSGVAVGDRVVARDRSRRRQQSHRCPSSRRSAAPARSSTAASPGMLPVRRRSRAAACRCRRSRTPRSTSTSSSGVRAAARAAARAPARSRRSRPRLTTSSRSSRSRRPKAQHERLRRRAPRRPTASRAGARDHRVVAPQPQQIAVQRVRSARALALARDRACSARTWLRRPASASAACDVADPPGSGTATGTRAGPARTGSRQLRACDRRSTGTAPTTANSCPWNSIGVAGPSSSSAVIAR